MTLVLPSVPSLISVRGFGQNQPTQGSTLEKVAFPCACVTHPQVTSKPEMESRKEIQVCLLEWQKAQVI